MFNNILTVCVGNICRSPMAERLLAEKLADKNITVTSAGLKALAGKPMDAKARDVMARHGHDAEGHTAQQLEERHLQQADIILVMEKVHVEGVLAMAPQMRGKVFLVGKWKGEVEIPDPFRQQQSMFDHVYMMIDECVNAWVKRLG